MADLFLIAALSYLLGSIPFGYLLVRIFRGEDIRRSGSGNIGATNVSRTSPALGALTLLLDALKGTAAVVFAYILAGRIPGKLPATEYAALAALFAVAGHVFPLWLKFRGGKGVATGLGSFALIAPKAVLITVAVFVVLVAAFRYVSMGSIFSVAAFPFVAWRLDPSPLSSKTLMAMALASLLIVAKHHQNIRRLFAGTESRIGSKRT